MDIEKVLFVRTETDNNYPGLVVIREIPKKVDYILDLNAKEPLKLHENMVDAIRVWLIGRKLDPDFMNSINNMYIDKMHQLESRQTPLRSASVGGRKRRTRKYKK
jgi:hypothetical protein